MRLYPKKGIREPTGGFRSYPCREDRKARKRIALLEREPWEVVAW